MKLLWAFLLMAPLFGGQQAAHAPSDAIEEGELRAHLAKQFECEDPSQIYFWSLDQYDFLGKGYNQAVVVASTCMTGTAGPDVHSVFTRDAKGQLKELEFETYDASNKPGLQVLFGNPNSDLSVADGLLVETFHDTSGRDHPLVLKFKWDAVKQRFVLVSEITAKQYPTSYDCAKATTDVEQAICYVESLADLDLELGKTYKELLAGLDGEARKQAVTEEREWLAKREKDCPIYKWWVGCLEDMYTKRIAELQKRTFDRKKQPLASQVTP